MQESSITPEKRFSARQLVEKCSNATPRYACIAAGILGSRTDAEDIVQQAITIAIQKDNKFESESTFLNWVAGIVRHCALNHRRKQIRRKTLLTDPVEMATVESTQSFRTPIDQKTGELNPLQLSFDDQVNLALTQVSHQARSCLLLRTVEGLNYKEISELMNIPEGTAMTLVHRSKKTIRAFLERSSSANASGLNGEQQREGGMHG